MHGEQISKEEVMEEMQSVKKLDDIDPNLELGVDQEIPLGEDLLQSIVFNF